MSEYNVKAEAERAWMVAGEAEDNFQDPVEPIAAALLRAREDMLDSALDTLAALRDHIAAPVGKATVVDAMSAIAGLKESP